VALVDSGRAIGAVTRLLKDRLETAMFNLPLPQVRITEVSIGRPEPPKHTSDHRRLNLFLYEVQLDGHLKNVNLDDRQPAPLWLVLRYLMTAFDKADQSDSDEAHDILGEAMGVLQTLNFFSLDGLLEPSIVAPLDDNPDRLKLTFDDASVELLSKLMQGTEARHRCSVAFQVRPVMIAPAEPPTYSLLVGVDYTTGTIPGEAAIHVPVLPSLGPSISQVEPEEFIAGTSVTIHGTDLDGPGLAVQFGGVELAVSAQRPDRLTFTVSPSLEDGGIISAGSHPLAVTQLIPTGRHRTSNLLVAGLLPRLADVAPSGVVHIPPGTPSSPVRGLITINGFLLGTDKDDVYAALYRDGVVVEMYDVFQRPTTNQTQLLLNIPVEKAVPEGEYRLILRVNGRQARTSPSVVLTP
jgi:uncharacterized protein DUF4255/IPT/TIG domain-containing protein